MDRDRRTAIIVGALFIIGDIAGILSAVVTGPVLNDTAPLVVVSANQTRMALGAILVLVMGFTLAMVPVMLFPIFRKHNEALAVGAVVFRGALEAVAYVAIVVGWLLLIALGQEFVKAGSPDASTFQTSGALLLEGVDWINQMLAIVFSLGALMIYTIFYQSKLIPRWLSAWGLIGGVLYLTVPLLALFGIDWGFLMAPLALQEPVLALWLIVKGFSPSAIAPEAASPSVLRSSINEA
jgi:hypothetical protein